MKRIDVLKGIKQILVQKAYETGHISHRADGDWQKQADGSWIPYKGQSAQNPNKKDRYGFNLLPDEDKQGYLDRANGDSYQAQILYEKDIENSPMGGLDEEEDQYDEITEEDLKEDSNDWEEEDTRNSWLGEEDLKVSTPIKNKLSKEEKSDINNKLYDVLSFYDSDSKKLFGMKRIDGGGVDGSPNISYDWKTDKILPADKDKFDKVVRHYMDKADIEDTPLNYKQTYNTIKGMAINNGMLKTTNHPLDTVNKSYRDMRSAPTTKNMGF